MENKIIVGKGRMRNRKKYVHEEINAAAMKRCWINSKTFILIPLDADEEAERAKYLENHQRSF